MEKNAQAGAHSSLRSFPSARDAISAFSECSTRLSDFLESLNSSRDELIREAETLRERERRLSEELIRFRGLDEELEKQKLAVAEADRRRMVQEDSLRTAQDDLNAKGESLNRLREEYKTLLERFNASSTELEALKVGHIDAERKRHYYEEAAEQSQSELRDRKKELAELNVKLLDQTTSMNEMEARLQDLEGVLQRSNTEVVAQAQELKETKWELLQLREDLRVTKSELTRKSGLLVERETELEARNESLRVHQDGLADGKREVQRMARLVSEHEEALTRANEKIAEQSVVVVRLDKELAKAQDEAETRRRTLRQLEERRKLDEAERIALEQELAVTRDAFKKKVSAADQLEKELEIANRRFEAEAAKRRDAEEQRNRTRIDLQNARDQISELHQAVATADEKFRQADDEASNLKKDLEALQHEHKGLLRVETRQADELEQLSQELNKKSEQLREAQSKLSAQREQLDMANLKLEQQAMSLVNLQQKSARDQEELQTFKRQLQKATKLPQLEAENESLRQEITARNLRMEQQEQLIRMLQSRLGDKRVVPLPAREGASAGSPPPPPASGEENRTNSGLKIS